MSLGLKSAGFDIIAAIEMNADAVETYKHNIGDHTRTEDITKYHPKDLRKSLIYEKKIAPEEKISLIAGGPPRTRFSLIGRSKISELIKKNKKRKLQKKRKKLGTPLHR